MLRRLTAVNNFLWSCLFLQGQLYFAPLTYYDEHGGTCLLCISFMFYVKYVLVSTFLFLFFYLTVVRLQLNTQYYSIITLIAYGNQKSNKILMKIEHVISLVNIKRTIHPLSVVSYKSIDT